jgi:hypothetical protein
MATDTAAKPGRATDDPRGDQPPPPDLLTLFRTGATLNGVPVRVVRVETADGRVQRFELPWDEGAGGVVADTPMKRAVVQAVDEMKVGEVVSYEKLARLAGFSNSGPLREFVKEYAEAGGRLEPHRQGWEKVK